MNPNKPCLIPQGMEVCEYMCVCVSIKSCQCAEIECVSRGSETGCLHGSVNMPITKRQMQLTGVEVGEGVGNGQPLVGAKCVCPIGCRRVTNILAARCARQSVTAITHVAF